MEVEAVFGWGVGGSIPGGTVLKNPPANAGDVRDMGSGSGSGKSHGVRSVNPLQYSCLENPRDRGAWQVTVHGVLKSQTQLSKNTTGKAFKIVPSISVTYDFMIVLFI